MAKTRQQLAQEEAARHRVCGGAFRALTDGEWRTTQRPVYQPLWDLVYRVAVEVEARRDPTTSRSVQESLGRLLGTVQDAVTRQQVLSVLADGAALSREMDQAVAMANGEKVA